MKDRLTRKSSSKKMIRGAVLLALAAIGTAANAQVDRGFIGPHEYALPVDFKPFNIFVQYAYMQDTKDVWNASGNKAKTATPAEAMVGLTKYVRLWTPEFSSKVGLAWEVIVPEIGIRDKTPTSLSSPNTPNSTGGMGDPITGFAAWYKPSDNWTLGMDLFAAVPVGDKAVGGGDHWAALGSIFWDAQYGKVNYTGNFGYHFNGNSVKPNNQSADYWHLNNRLGYRVTSLLEPYVGLDYQSTASYKTLNGTTPVVAASGHETSVAAGIMFHTYDHSSIGLHYSKGIDGKNAAVSNSLNLKFAYVF